MGRTWLLNAPLIADGQSKDSLLKQMLSRRNTYDAVDEAVATVASDLRFEGTLLSDWVKATAVWDLNGLVWPTALRAFVAWRLRSMVSVEERLYGEIRTRREAYNSDRGIVGMEI